MKLKTKKILTTAIIVALLALVVMPIATNATSKNASKLFDLENAQFGLGNKALKTGIEEIIQVLLGFLGIIAVLVILWGGFIWMTAMGDEGKVEKAKKMIIAGIIGIIIILAAFAIAQFVIERIGEATGTGQ